MLRSETKTPNSDTILKLRFAAELLKPSAAKRNSTLVCGTTFASLQSSYSSAAKVFATFFILSTRESCRQGLDASFRCGAKVLRGETKFHASLWH